jgi:hypothetical protein
MRIAGKSRQAAMERALAGIVNYLWNCFFERFEAFSMLPKSNFEIDTESS